MVEAIIEKFITNNLERINNLAKNAYDEVSSQVDIGLRTAYSNYLSKTRLKYSKSKSFFIRNQPVELYTYYVPTGIRCGEKVIEKPTFENCLDFTKRVVISGTGGSGKSVLMKHLFLNCIETNNYIPILIELRDLNSYDKTLDDFINETLSTFEFNTKEKYVMLAKESGHFSFFFDGFDEVDPSQRSKVITYIKRLSKKYPSCPILISSRPDDVLSGLDEFTNFRMMPLSLVEAVSLVKKLPFDVVIKNKFTSNLQSGLFEKHESFLSNPLLLSIMLLTYGENAEIPSKLSIFYEQAYVALYTRHDAYKEGYKRKQLTNLDLQDFSKIFSLFCLQSYEKRLFKMSRTQCLDFIKKSINYLNFDTNAEDYLTDLLSAACLLLEDGLEIAFSHRSFQEYFVAVQISSSPPEIQKKLINLYWTKISVDNVMPLLLEINETLVERELIIPRLEEFFSEVLGVKKSIGITHYLKYMKYIHESLLIENEGIYSMYDGSAKSNENRSMNRLVHMILKRYTDFTFPCRDEFIKYSKVFYDKYAGKVSRKEIKVKNLTIKSEVLIDLSNFNQYSILIPQKTFEAFKFLKSKHNNSTQNFENLLGIR